MPSTSLELEDLPRNYLINRLDNFYLNPLVDLAFPCKNWPPNMEFLPGMLEKPWPRMVWRTGNVNPAPDIHLGRLREQELQLTILEETFFSSSIIPFIQKSKNSPNSSQIRQIEKFWAILKERAAGRHQVSECWNKESTKSWWSWSLLSAKPCLEDSRLRSEKQQISAFYQ